ncbi:hypothetical protein AB1207_01295 [Kineococcus endophyticus]|uniref:DUF4129 domain-containing protein n=1 Tax=Kineococcus endophyticus TaxID=1181883 RepID=A0ABV3P180_9ACTN
MGVELSKPGGPEDRPPQVAPPDRPVVRIAGGAVEQVGPDQLEPRLGTDLPVLGFVPDPAFQLLRYVGLGGWILLYVLWWPLGFIGMWAWIALNVAHENEVRRRKRLRRHYRRALRAGQVVLSVDPVQHPAPSGPRPVPPPPPPPAWDGSPAGALAATVARVDASGRFADAERALVHEVADLLGPLLRRIAERGADPQVRHDLETLAGEHLPRTVEDFLSLPDDVARGHRDAGGLTPADELRNQLHLLLEGCRRLREAVLAADVDRQRQQSRFLEAKFRGGDLQL